MKHVLLFLCWLGIAQSAFAQTMWKSDATAVTVSTIPPGCRVGVAVIRADTEAYYTQGSYTPVTPWQEGETKEVRSFDLGVDFYIVVFAAPNALWNRVAEGVKYRWISAYQVDGDEPQTSKDGPYGPDGPTDDNGNPVDPKEGGPPDRSYKASVDISSAPDSIENRTFMITAKEGDVVIYRDFVTLVPGEDRTISMTNQNPFTLSAQEVVPKITPYNPEIPAQQDPSNPDNWNKIGPENTVNSTGQTDPPPAGGGPEGTNQKTAQNGSAPKPAVSNQPRDGTPEGNADARNQELREEIQRMTDQVKTSGDGIKAGIDETNKELKKLGGGTGNSGTGADLGTPSPEGLSFALGIGAKASGLGNALGNLLNASGLGLTNPGNNALTWQVPVMGDTVTVSIEEHSGVFQGVRTAILWVASAFFIWRVFSIMRGAFVDEGGK